MPRPKGGKNLDPFTLWIRAQAEEQKIRQIDFLKKRCLQSIAIERHMGEEQYALLILELENRRIAALKKPPIKKRKYVRKSPEDLELKKKWEDLKKRFGPTGIEK